MANYSNPKTKYLLQRFGAKRIGLATSFFDTIFPALVTPLLGNLTKMEPFRPVKWNCVKHGSLKLIFEQSRCRFCQGVFALHWLLGVSSRGGLQLKRQFKQQLWISVLEELREPQLLQDVNQSEGLGRFAGPSHGLHGRTALHEK